MGCQQDGVLAFHKLQVGLPPAEQSTEDAEHAWTALTHNSDAPTMQQAEVLTGLLPWLAELSLSNYAEAAALWAEEQGAADLDDIVENLADFADGLGLKRLE